MAESPIIRQPLAPEQVVPQPVVQLPSMLVENIYLEPDTAQPDTTSAAVMGDYLVERFMPDEGPTTRVVMTPSGVRLPGFERETVGEKPVSRFRFTKEWFIRPRTALAVTLGSLALFNVVGNHESLEGAAKWSQHKVYRFFKPVESHTKTTTKTVTTPGETVDIQVSAATGNEVGSAEVDPKAIKLFVKKIRKAEAKGGKIDSISVQGNTSDEWSDDSSIGVADAQNHKLGLERSSNAVKAIEATGLDISKIKVNQTAKEHVISPTEKRRSLRQAAQSRITNLKDAISAIDQDKPVPPSFAARIKRLFTDKQNRGATLSAKIEQPGKDTKKTVKSTVTIEGKDKTPDVPDSDFYGFIPLIPIRRMQKYFATKPLRKWSYRPSEPIMRPHVIREQKDQAWLRIRPEAVQEDSTLVESPWAYTRKFEHLLRDGRIADVIRADFKNPAGEDKSIRVMFVDEPPATETVEAFEEILTRLAAAQDGKVADRVSGIFVFPSEYTGTWHGIPKWIGLGIDKQSSENVLGTYTYIMDLVELHMPSMHDPEKLEKLFAAFDGPIWTLSHEAGGHGTDDTDNPLRLRPVRARGIPNAHVIKGNPAADRMRPLRKVLRKLHKLKQDQPEPHQFDISYPVTDQTGRTVTMEARVAEGDPRLAHATQSTIVGYRPTQYGGTNDAEHYAETAASVISGMSVPYSEANVTIPELKTDDGGTAVFADGYRPDVRGQHLFTEAVGAISGEFPATFSEPPEVRITHTHPENDKLIREAMIRARSTVTLRPEQMVAILARVLRRDKK